MRALGQCLSKIPPSSVAKSLFMSPNVAPLPPQHISECRLYSYTTASDLQRNSKLESLGPSLGTLGFLVMVNANKFVIIGIEAFGMHTKARKRGKPQAAWSFQGNCAPKSEYAV